MKIKILAFAGSSRKDSYNKKLVRIAAKGAEDAGAEVTIIDLKDYPLPFFDEDYEAEHGLPDAAKKLKALMNEHQGFLISSPEYNSSFSSLLKNAIDWASRKINPNEQNLHCFKGKVATIMSASPGSLGGLRGLVHLRAMLENMNVLVLPSQESVPIAHEAFQSDGNLINKSKQKAIETLGADLCNTLKKLH